MAEHKWLDLDYREPECHDGGIRHHGDASAVPPQCPGDAAVRPLASIPKQPEGFLECDACAAKPGTPVLCVSCLANRWTIADLAQRLKQAQEDAQAFLDGADAGLRLARRSLAKLEQSPVVRLEAIRIEALAALAIVESSLRMVRVVIATGK